MVNGQVIHDRPCPVLHVTGTEAEVSLQQMVQRGRNLRDTPVDSEEDLVRARAALVRWDTEIRTLIWRLFSDPAIVREYDLRIHAVLTSEPVFHGGPMTIDGRSRRLRRAVERRILELNAALARIEGCRHMAA